jgi:heme/copper-type cytochrome/quinol oxidase subunit 4
MGNTPRLEVSLVVLLALTGLAMMLGGARADTAPTAIAIGVALGLSAIKARIVLAEYLHLRTAPAWLSGFTSGLVVLVAILTILALIA